MMARFPNFYSLEKRQDVVKKGAKCFKQVQRFILAKKYFGVRGTLIILFYLFFRLNVHPY